MTRYAELEVTTHFSFLRGASSCEEFFAQAALEALAVTDRNSLAGIVRAHEAAKASAIRVIIGCETTVRTWHCCRIDGDLLCESSESDHRFYDSG
jgi:error-prone DNA polymerase